MAASFTRRLRWLAARLGLERDWSLVFTAALIGVIMGGLATAFILPLHLLEDAVSGLGAGHDTWRLVVVGLAPVVGALLAGAFMHFLPVDRDGSGVAGVMFAIHRSKSRLPLFLALRKWVAATLTIGSGGSAGPEGPIVTIGSVIGSNVGGLLKANQQNTTTLLGCAAAAGVASVFNAPIAGIFFVLEVLLRDFSLRTFTPIVIASVISASTTQTILGTNRPLFGVEPGFLAEGATFSLLAFPNFLLLGLMCGAIAPMLIRLLFRVQSIAERWPIPVFLRPSIGAAAVGALGVAFLVLAPGASTSHGVPPFFGTGYAFIRDLLSPAAYELSVGASDTAWALMALLVAVTMLKAVATCLTVGTGGAGGLFAPSLFIGASVGGLFGVVAQALPMGAAGNPAHYALVGMAAMLAATTHAPLTGILIVYEITRSHEIVLPVMFAAVISTVAARLLLRDSVYTWPLSRRGVRVGAMSDLTILRRLAAREVPLSPAIEVHEDDSAQRLLDLSETHAVGDFVVVDDRRQYAGMVTGADLRAALVYREAIPLLQVSELQRSDLPTVSPDESLDVVLDKFSRHDVPSLAVLDPGRDGAVLGLISRAKLMQVYQGALSKD